MGGRGIVPWRSLMRSSSSVLASPARERQAALRPTPGSLVVLFEGAEERGEGHDVGLGDRHARELGRAVPQPAGAGELRGPDVGAGDALDRVLVAGAEVRP